MRIEKIILKNFSLFKSALNKNKIEIDFSNFKNRIILIQGDNGSGKTSLLSNLHPFPHLGSLDVRSSNNLITEGKDGYKYLKIIDKDNEYEIEHFYNYLKDNKWKLSSYIKKNGTELNVSGSVTNFYKCIEDEFEIDYSFLKIIRLGSNVNNLIKLKSAERKEFVSILLSDIDIYTKLFKTVNNKSKELKIRLKVLAESINKINIVDISQYEEKMNKLSLYRDNQLNKINSCREEVASIDGILSEISYSPENDKDLLSLISENKKIKLLLTNLSEEDYSDIENLDEEYIKESIIKLKYDIDNNKKQLKDLESDINSYIDDISIYEQKLITCKALPIKDSIYEELDKINERLSDKKLIINLYNREDILNDNEKLNEIDRLLIEIFTIDEKSYQYFVLKYNSTGFDINKTRTIINEDYANLLSIKPSKKKIVPPVTCAIYKSCECYKECNSIISEDEYNEQYNILKNALIISDIIISIFKILDSRDISLPFKCSDNLINYYITNKEKMNGIKLSENKVNYEIICTCNEEEEINILNNRKEELLKDLGKIESEGDLKLESLNENISLLKKLVDKCTKDKINIIEEIEKLKDELDKNILLKDKFDKYNLYLSNKKEYEDKINSNTEKISNLTKIKERAIELINTQSVFKKQINELESGIRINDKEILKLKVDKQAYDEYSKEKSKISEIYDVVELVKESLSTNKGIPLLFMQLYFKGIQVSANEMISKIYGDRLIIDNFVIDDKNFRIPYSVNGVSIYDIANASQGEASIINLAISLAIINNFVKNYNILLLDEIDGTLTKENREKFFSILDNELNRINSEQVFIISHNKLYETYPCDIIATTENAIIDLDRNSNIGEIQLIK